MSERLTPCVACRAPAQLHWSGKCRACRVIKCAIRDCQERFLQTGEVEKCLKHRKIDWSRNRKRTRKAVPA